MQAEYKVLPDRTASGSPESACQGHPDLGGSACLPSVRAAEDLSGVLVILGGGRALAKKNYSEYSVNPAEFFPVVLGACDPSEVFSFRSGSGAGPARHLWS